MLAAKNLKKMQNGSLRRTEKSYYKLDLLGIDYALYGGLALAIYARPRATLDIDMMIESDFFEISPQQRAGSR